MAAVRQISDQRDSSLRSNSTRRRGGMSTIVFRGGGRITSAMLAGLRLGRTRHRLVVHDRNPDKLRDLKKRYAVAVEPDLNRAVEQADMLIVAVRPSSVRELLGMVGNVNRRSLAVSLAAGIPLRVLSRVSGPPMHWARAMPSPVCRSGRGLTAVAFPRSLPRADRKRVQDFFSSFGQGRIAWSMCARGHTLR